MAFGTGWFARDGDEVRSLNTAVDLLACNRAGASYMLPLGAMRLAGKDLLRLKRDPKAASYWVPRDSGAVPTGSMKDQF